MKRNTKSLVQNSAVRVCTRTAPGEMRITSAAGFVLSCARNLQGCGLTQFKLKILAATCMVIYLYLAGHLWDNFGWQLTVAYVGANHFLYGAHHLLGSSGHLSKTQQVVVMKLAGLGGILKNDAAGSWFWGFDEHRVSDVCVHLGMALSHPWRLDHWVELLSHLSKYLGCHFESLHDRIHGSSLSVCDLMDVCAHCASALHVLGMAKFAAAVCVAEFVRWWIYYGSGLGARSPAHQG